MCMPSDAVTYTTWFNKSNVYRCMCKPFSTKNIYEFWLFQVSDSSFDYEERKTLRIGLNVTDVEIPGQYVILDVDIIIEDSNEPPYNFNFTGMWS